MLSSENENVVRSSQQQFILPSYEILAVESPIRSPLLSIVPRNTSKSISRVLSGLSCWYTNATSLNSDKLDELRAECLDTNYHVRFVTETWFNDQSVVHIDGYDCFRRDRIDKKGGGVCIYARSSGALSFRDTNYDQLNSNSIEQVWCLADTGIELILLGCIYRAKIMKNNKGVTCSVAEHKKRDEEINKSIRFTSELVKKGKVQGLIIAEDFNYGELSWNELLESEILMEAEPSGNFLDTLNECFLTQNVFFKTFQQDSSNLTSLLDLIITESKERVYELKQGEVFGNTEKGHLTLSWKYAVKEEHSDKFGSVFRKNSFNYKKGDYGRMRSFFEKINWVQVFADKNVRECYEKFMAIYENACEKFIPKLHERRRKFQPPWLDKELRNMLRVKRGLWHKFISTGRKSSEVHRKYKDQCKLVRVKMNSKISSFEYNLARNSINNPRALYSYMKNKQQVKESIRSLNNTNGISTVDRAEIANILNEQFESVFSVDDGLDTFFENRTNFICCEEELIKRKNIIERLDKLDCNKSSGADGISQFVLKNCSNQISVALEIIFKKSFNESEIPEQWREANITPLFKKGSKLVASNYRPVSLTSVCCKLMEGIVRDRIMNHLNDYDLISSSQHGFVPKRACVTNLLECQHVVSDLLNKNILVDVLYTDFEKAFD